MASIIRIKRSSVAGNPTTLAAGELAYSALVDNGSNGGDRLYIGMGTETNGNAANHVVIGGKYFTDMVTAATDANTASTLVKRDASGNFSAGTITAALSGNASTATALATGRTISLTGDVTYTSGSFDGTGNVTGTATLANSGVTAGSYGSSTAVPVITVDAKGRVTGVTTSAISIPTSLSIAGGTGTDSVTLGTDTLTFAGGTGVTTTVTNNQVSFAIGQAVSTTSDVTFNNITGNGTVTVPDPVNSTDAANKGYVDSIAQGLNPKQSVDVATTTNMTLSSDGSGTSVTIDGLGWFAGTRVLVKNQTNPNKNGIYEISYSGPWTRTSDANTGAELASAYVFVQSGDTQADSGWYCTADSNLDITEGSIYWVQFTGAGQITAGSGMTKTGNTLDVIGTANRIVANADSIDIASTYVGQTSITTLGTLTTGTWNATAIGVGYGGTGLTSYTSGDLLYASGTTTLAKLAIGSAGKVLAVNDSGSLAWSDIDGGTY